ncbi:hypothetical protein MBLNU13_g06928t1 [Cladosporium sp. NU13]
MNSTPTATSIAASPLSKLPPEPRLRIYEYVLCSDEYGLCKVTCEDGIPEAVLLLTCKFIRTEAIAVFYTVNNFEVITNACHPAALVFMARKLARLMASGVNTSGIQYESMVAGSRNYANVTLWLKYVHLGEASDPNLVDEQRKMKTGRGNRFLQSLFRIAMGMRKYF